MYTVYEIETGKIVSRPKIITYHGVPDGCDWIAGRVDDVRFRIDHATGEPYPFIEQDQLPSIIRQRMKRLLQQHGATELDISRWQAAKIEHQMLGDATIDGVPYSDEAFRDLLAERKRILDRAAVLMAMSPIPQDAEDDRWWQPDLPE
jgi:hypothetical protein